MADVSASDIEAYISGVINLDAATVSEVAPVAAQAALELANVSILDVTDVETFLTGLNAIRREATNGAVLRVLRKYQDQFADSTLTPAEAIQSIIDLIGG